MTRAQAEEAAANIIHYYESRRAVGHTHAMVTGLIETPALVLVPVTNMARSIYRSIQDQSFKRRMVPPEITFLSIRSDLTDLRHSTCPLVLEHTAIVEILSALIGPKRKGKKTVKAVV